MWGLPLFAAQIRGDSLSEGFGTSELLKASMSLTVEGFTIQFTSILFYGVSDGLYNFGRLVLVTFGTISFTLGLSVLSLRSISSKKLSSGKYLLGMDGRLQHS